MQQRSGGAAVSKSVRANLYAVLLTAALVCIAAALGCGSGNVTTSTGAIRPAAEVQTIDNLADARRLLADWHTQAVADYERTKASLPADERARQYRTLNTMADALDASKALLVAYK